jgi:protoheme IX farnesyltransferase
MQTVLNTEHRPLAASSLEDFITLTKPGVMSLVVFTAAVGLLLAPGELHPVLKIIAVFCVALGSAGGAALNMWYDRDIDAVMHRTAARPLPSGSVAPEDAFAFGMILSLISVGVMGLALNWLAAGILAFAIAFYAVVYTQWLKRSTEQNIVIGGAAGAFPPVIGWAAVTGDISWHSVTLFMIIFLWTPPHFWALALYRNADYIRANIPMMPVKSGIPATTRQMLAYTIVLVAVTLFPTFMGWQGMMYGVAAAALGAGFLFHAVRVWRSPVDGFARKMFGFSILYLFTLFAAMLADRWMM